MEAVVAACRVVGVTAAAGWVEVATAVAETEAAKVEAARAEAET